MSALTTEERVKLFGRVLSSANPLATDGIGPFHAAGDVMAKAMILAHRAGDDLGQTPYTWYDAVERRWPGFDRWLGGATGSMVGWAFNVARAFLDELGPSLPPEPEPTATNVVADQPKVVIVAESFWPVPFEEAVKQARQNGFDVPEKPASVPAEVAAAFHALVAARVALHKADAAWEAAEKAAVAAGSSTLEDPGVETRSRAAEEVAQEAHHAFANAVEAAVQAAIGSPS